VDEQLENAGIPNDLRAPYWSVVRGNTGTRGEAGAWWPVFAGDINAEVADEDRDFVTTAFDLLGEPPYTATTWSDWTNIVKAETGRKGRGLFMPLRLAITGQARGPEMADVMPLLQKKPSLD
ncbi:MAG: glutamate--tRNA ligase, partial [Boseongicola sp.]|nr:glutamate--tRNA ligase [Boseongicola sp.]